ncbi:hypothetical protein GTA08_BOTSDO00465 [Botryosphaeria dothidea]|uniref:Uncharacterized protein n=1 Tax=Botryosphaeria dothidea TaxID=55169 RepID=A0A8H4NB14_9PEZI|nr:hypothetical protein GTA08_BOTSDO00465 [Botryosphaeria dothidea]
MKDDPSVPSSHTDGLEAFPQAKPSAQPSTPSTTTSRSASIASNSTTASASTAATSIVAALAQDKPATLPTRATTERRRRSNPNQLPSTMMTHDTAVRRVHDLEAALSTARTQQHRLAVELEKLRMQQTAQQGSRRTSLPGTNIPSIFSRSPSISTDGGSTVSGSGDQEWGITDLMAEAARNCERMEDRLAFQRQIVSLRDKIYAQAEELNERKRERKEWKEEREELIRELKKKDERIKGLEKTGIQG